MQIKFKIEPSAKSGKGTVGETESRCMYSPVNEECGVTF
jgi:hypothetical protein